jgi:hypothetical protein
MRNLLILLVRGQRIDRRYLYLLLAVIVGAPFVFDIPVPPAVVLPQTRAFYDTIEQMANDPTAKNKLVILSTNYGAGTLAENNTQAEAVMRHLMKRHLKFAIFAFNDPQGRELGQRVADSIQDKYSYVYGRDYVNIGYRPADVIVPLLKAAVRDVPGAFGNDIRGTPLAQVPVMQGVKTANDIGLIIEITPSATVGAWIQFYQRTGDKPIPTLFCPTAVMAPEAFPYLKSGQLQGMLTGLGGAIEYEVLTGEKGFGTRASASLSYAHLLIIVLIILGNAGMFAERYLRRERDREGR